MEHLDGTPSPRDLKYGILHLQASVEILLKARLIREHWSLVCVDPGKSSLDDYRRGSFRSISAETTVARLATVAGIELPERSKNAFTRLARERNKLQHFGFQTSAADFSAEVEIVSGKALDALLEFMDIHLSLGADDDTTQRLDSIRPIIVDALQGIRALAAERRARISTEVERFKTCLVRCITCDELTLRVDGLGGVECLYCRQSWLNSLEAAMSYCIERETLVRQPDEVAICPECQLCTAVFNVERREPAGLTSTLCFNCGEFFDEASFTYCQFCAELFHNPAGSSGVDVCDACFTIRLAKD